MRNDRHDEPLSAEELELFLQYLHRFAIHDVDQFTVMEVGDPDYPCYLNLSRVPEPGVHLDVYRRP